MLTFGGHRPLRLPVRAKVMVSDGVSAVAGEVLNLSVGGAYVAVAPPIPIDRGISFWLDLSPAPILVRGYVRWTRSLAAGMEAPVGFGMEFFDPDGQLAERIAGALKVLADAP